MELLQRLQDAVGAAYRPEREIGQGGMATVYLAHDVKHDRPVALKVLHPELAAMLGAERFLAEIRITANLQHPHILPLFDSGEARGERSDGPAFLYYVMPFVQGESLRARIAREGQLPVEQAVRLAREVASALDYAHRQGVVHRDIKPENILLQDGTALVADFGIALAVTRAGGNRLTQTGLSLGTPSYMSPEQAMGDRAVDQRSDIYSLACTLYEMLAGEPPFSGPSAQAVVAKVITEAAPLVTGPRPTTPAHVAAALQRGLQKLPADRFESAAEFAAALDASAARTVTLPAGVAGVRAGGGSRSLRWWQVAAGVAALVAVGSLAYAARRPAPPVTYQLARQLTFEGDVAAAAISPDGSWLAYIGTDCAPDSSGCAAVLSTREVDGTQSVRVARWPAMDPAVRWSPDGGTVLFRGSPEAGDAGGTYLVNRLGGAVKKLWGPATAMDWTPDGRRVVLLTGRPGAERLLWIDAATLAPADSVPLPRGVVVHDIAVSPRGAIAASAGLSAARSVLLFDAHGRQRDSVAAGGVARTSLRWSPAGDALLFFVAAPGIGDNMYRIPVHGDRFDGAHAAPALQQVETGYVGALDVSRGGRIALIVAPTSHAFRVFRPDHPGDVWREVHRRTGYVDETAPSPDGSAVAAVSTDNLGDNIYVFPLDGGEPRPVSGARGLRFTPRWSPDGRHLLYGAVDPDRAPNLVVADVAGGRERTVVPAYGDREYDWIAGDRVIARVGTSYVVADTAGKVLRTLPIPDSLGDPAIPLRGNPATGTAVYWSGRAGALVTVDATSGRFAVFRRSSRRLSPLGWDRDGAVLAAPIEGQVAARVAHFYRADSVYRYTPDGKQLFIAPVDPACSDIASAGTRLFVCATEQSRPDVWLADVAGRSEW